jgi:hypothetical protein
MLSSSRRPLVILAVAAISTIGSVTNSHAQVPQGGPPPPAPSAPSPYTPQNAPPGPAPLETGGLRPPSAAPPLAPNESETVAQLERAEREDSGRGLEFIWVDVEAGYEYLSLQAFHSSSLLDDGVLADSGSGLSLGAGAGVRLVFLTLGARLRIAQLSDWNLWTLGGELGLHLPLGALEPSFRVGVGYASLASPSAEGLPELDSGLVDVSGIDARLGASLDYYVNPLLSFGVRGSFELLALWRAGAPGATAAGLPASYAEDGDGIGYGATIGVDAGLHF